jgi:clan AA aspartic protease (TIGR02281 family)
MMRRFTVGLLIFMAGWGLGWYAHHFWSADPGQSVDRVIPALPNAAAPPENTAAVITPVVTGAGDSIADLLARNAFDAALERYEALQARADDAAVADAKNRILSHARQLVAEGSFSLAEQLLQRFLVATYRDVDARVLLAEAYRSQDNFLAAIDQLYEARGYAYQPDKMQKITVRIRSIVAELAQQLKHNDDQETLLVLYQHLTQLEPDHAPWFLGLAETQMSLADPEAARRSLVLVSQDPDVGMQAQAKLAELDLALAGMQDSELQDAVADVVGIPLHRSGNHFIVDAIPANGRSMQLLIDTGASLTIFTPEVLEQHGIRYHETGRSDIFNTANGPVRAPVYKLDYLSVGGWQVHHLEIGVLDLGNGAGVDGLLGMNFLSHFQFFIDQNESLLRLSAN